MSAMVKLAGVGKSFGATIALDKVSFEAPTGKIFGFLGPNGAGKTTAIRCMLDFLRPDTGTITIAGLDSRRDATELKRHIGYLPADDFLYDRWTGADHIRFLGEVRGVKTAPKLAEQLKLDTSVRVSRLSTGNRQKLSIALAFIGQPELLILDEPTRGLDPILQNQLYEILEDFRAGGGTIFMSSHNLPEIERVCDSIALIRGGKLVVEETLDRLREKSLHHINVTFMQKVEPNLFELGSVEIMQHAASSFRLRVRGDITPVIHLIGRHQLKDLEVTHASLEEIFLELYQ